MCPVQVGDLLQKHPQQNRYKAAEYGNVKKDFLRAFEAKRVHVVGRHKLTIPSRYARQAPVICHEGTPSRVFG